MLRKIFTFIFFFTIVIQKICTQYLSSDQFRDLIELEGDFNSAEYYKYFIMNLKYFNNDPLQYIRTCSEGNLFGYFRYGNITNYLSYENYGALGINFNLIINRENFSPTLNDTIQFIINNELNDEVFLGNFTKNYFNPVNATYCDKDVMIFNVTLIFINKKYTQYSPIQLTIQSNIDIMSDIYWAIANVKFYMLACPQKCVMCNHLSCLSCGKNMVMKSGSCQCDSTNDYYDFANSEERINCLCKFFGFYLNKDYSFLFFRL